MIDVVMPQMGESIVEGTLTKWLKKAGEHVERDEPLFEISTDKVDTEIPSPSSGVLSEILVQEGTVIAINAVVGRISDGASAPAPAPAPARAAAPAPPVPLLLPLRPLLRLLPRRRRSPAAEEPASTDESAGPLSPLVRKMARENNIDLSKVRGTGAGGRITKHDLEAFIATPAPAAAPAAAPQPQAAPAPPPPPPPPQAPAPQPMAVATVQAPVDVPQQPREVAPSREPAPMAGAAPAYKVEPMSVMRQKIAEHMIFSKRTSAHVTTVHKADMTK